MPDDLRAQLQLALRDPQLVAAGLFRTVKLTLFFRGSHLCGARSVPYYGVAVSCHFRIAMVLVVFISPLWAAAVEPDFGLAVSTDNSFPANPRLRQRHVTRNQRARESFKQNLEAATLNPADASAHYNLGLIHQQRSELKLRENDLSERFRSTKKSSMRITSWAASRVLKRRLPKRSRTFRAGRGAGPVPQPARNLARGRRNLHCRWPV